MIWLLFFLGAWFFFLGSHPFTTYPLSLWAIRRWQGGIPYSPSAISRNQTVALCFCAYNEERVIRDKIQNCLELRQVIPGLEVLAYVDAATDRTAELLRVHDTDFTLRISSQRCGKTHGMNLLATLTQASILVFTDANVMVDREALSNLQRYFADPGVGCVCGHLTYVNPNATATAATGSLYWRLEEWIKQLETDTGSAMGADGSLFAIRRALRWPVPDHLIDDMFVSLSALCDGFRVIRAGDVKAYEAAATSSRDEFWRKVRISCQGLNVHRVLWPRLRRLDGLTLYKYLSHKFLRWISAYNLALGIAFLELALLVAGLPWVAFAAALLIAGILQPGRVRRGRWSSQLWDIVGALVGSALGVWYSLRGVDFQVWTPAQSVRE
jgi:cellulose synthase/poly-beta-1,6-N-acetylglucosamine synthase-like glycosyltransferase